MECVIVTGLCRSGGAAVAEVCHHLGFRMAETLVAPAAPTWRLDWEDRMLGETLASYHSSREPIPRRFWSQYLSLREVSATMMLGEPPQRLGFKATLLHLYGEGLAKELRSRGWEWYGVVSVRAQDAIAKSIKAHGSRGVTMTEWNMAIVDSGPLKYAPTDGDWLPADYRSMVSNPEEQVRRLAAHLGVSDHDAIRRATRCVLAPTS